MKNLIRNFLREAIKTISKRHFIINKTSKNTKLKLMIWNTSYIFYRYLIKTTTIKKLTTLNLNLGSSKSECKRPKNKKKKNLSANAELKSKCLALHLIKRNFRMRSTSLRLKFINSNILRGKTKIWSQRPVSALVNSLEVVLTLNFKTKTISFVSSTIKSHN